MVISKAAVLVLLSAGLVGPLAAQQDQQPTREQLMRQIEQRFMTRVTEDLGLNAEQAARLRSTVTHYALERRRIEQQERDVKRGLTGQLRPGVAADQDSLLVLLDVLAEVRLAYIASFQNELAEMAEYLDPVQRAQYVLLRERLLEQIRRAQLARERSDRGPG